MKQVISKTENPKTVDIDLVNDSKYYGILFKDCCGFVTREDYNRGKFTAYCSRYITNGNHLIVGSKIQDSSLQKLLQSFLDYKGKVFEFGTPVELFAWVAKNHK